MTMIHICVNTTVHFVLYDFVISKDTQITGYKAKILMINDR